MSFKLQWIIKKMKFLTCIPHSKNLLVPTTVSVVVPDYFQYMLFLISLLYIST